MSKKLPPTIRPDDEDEKLSVARDYLKEGNKDEGEARGSSESQNDLSDKSTTDDESPKAEAREIGAGGPAAMAEFVGELDGDEFTALCEAVDKRRKSESAVGPEDTQPE